MRLPDRTGGNTFAMACFLLVACKGLSSRAVSGFDTGLESSAAISPERRPGDGAPSEIPSDAVAVVHEFLAVDDLSADGGFLSQRCDLYGFAGLPRAACHYESALGAEVVVLGNFGEDVGVSMPCH